VENWANKKVRLEDLKDADLPENMRKMDPAARRAHLEQLLKTRKSIQKKIADSSLERQRWLAKERQRRAAEQARSFDFEVRKAVRAQAEARGFRYSG
jgi:hypothetical protein